MAIDHAQAGFVRRLDEHRGILFKVADAYCRNRADREDLVQDIVAQLWRAYRRFDDRKSFATWMYRVAVNVAISFYRSETRRMRNVVPGEPSIVETIAQPPTEEPDEGLALVRAFIERLDPLDRALMILYLDDNPYASIADILGISQTNVATKISRIKQRLKLEVATHQP
ncbi:MAG TPA: RNA polymerase sigma factor [Candidatus Elarobacter sp.]|nr:RNA polymerase sigma factor [Candidatus Elarobacter sp.]HEV2737403.1 RNA polymerase sigma factor [Candidatus Elarobacter sp.]